jgi:NitT/TauT family transport system permease protein
MSSARTDTTLERPVSAESLGSRLGSTSQKVLWVVISLGGLTLIWQLAVMVFAIPSVVLPAPGDVAVAMVTYQQVLWNQGVYTTVNILTAFVISIAIGVPVAMAIAFSETANRLIYPILVITQAVPKIAIAPLLLIWFGFSSKTSIVLAVSLAVFPIIINFALGLKEIDRDLVLLGKVMGGSRWRLFSKVRAPNALPSLFAGMKLAITFAATGSVVAEFYAGGQGLGYLAQSSAGALNTTLTFGAIVAVSVITLALFYIIVGVEALVLRSRRDSSH